MLNFSIRFNWRRFLRRIIRLILVLFLLYLSTLVFFYFKQERFFFNPKHLDKNYVYEFKETFEEINLEVAPDVFLNSVLFKSPNSKGVFLYFHGNAGALHDWGKRAHLFLDNQYDVLFIDYRGYGKSDGAYSNSEELLQDAQKAYDFLKTRYKENEITVFGYSLGSGLAAYVASKNEPKRLIMNAPYYSWKTLIADEIAPPVPQYIINYDIPTYKYLDTVDCPVYIFQGTRDYLVNGKTNAEKLKQLYPDKITLHYVIDAAHNDIHITKQYYDTLKVLLR